MTNKTGKVIIATESTPYGAWLIGIAAWMLPGSGHLLQGKFWRGLLLGGVVLCMFIAGLLLGGHLFGVNGHEEGSSILLQAPPTVANFGAGLLYIMCWVTDTGFSEHAERATSEYGNTFLLVAGLLNYLSALDAFDICTGRKS